MAQNQTENTNFFKALFDLSFSEWVTLRVAGVLYGISLAVVGVFAVVSFISLLFSGGENIIYAIFLVPLGTFLTVLLVRLLFESAIATIAIAQNTESLKDK